MATAWILGLVLIAATAALAWALVDRARLAARAAAAEAGGAALRAAEADARGALESLRVQHAEALVREAALAERLNAEAAARTAHQADLERRLAAAHQAFRDAIDASAGKALGDTSRTLQDWAKRTFDAEQEKARAAIEAKVKPIDETLAATRTKLEEIEKERVAAYSRLAEQLSASAGVQAALREETGHLVAALRRPQVRGRYGEVQLRRVAELAGMRDYCDFDEQASTGTDAGERLRPDMVVRLPNGRCVVVDAKTNIEPYLDAIEASDPDDAERHLERFARHVAEQASALSKKGYWSQFDGAHDFVVMFIPGDQFIDAALQRRPDLLDAAAQQRVILASPSTLIGLLRAVHVGWREKRLSDRAQELMDLGRELHKRAAVAFAHAEGVGKAIRAAAEKYNDFVGSVERQLTPTLRRFEDAGAKSEKEMPELAPAEVVVRPIHSPSAPEPPTR